jgi:F-type H+-transporting ATPase subunit a
MRVRNKIFFNKTRVLFTLLLFLSNFAVAAEESSVEEAFNPGNLITEHVSDSHVWHFWEGHYGTIYLPVILYSGDLGIEVFSSGNFFNEEHQPQEYKGYKLEENNIVPVEEARSVYDFSITKNVAQMFLSVILLFWIFFRVKRGYRLNEGKAPKGIQSFFEPIILFIRDEVAKPVIGHKYERFLPYLLTLFFFIWFNAMMSLVPGSANVMGNIAVTMTLAIFTFLITLVNGKKHYWQHIFNTPGVPWWLKLPVPLMPFVELLSVFTKPFSLTIRLFANMIAGHIVLLSLISLIFVFKSVWIGPGSVVFGLFMNFLELFVALLQAFIFTILSAMYFGEAIEEGHESAEHA